MKAPIPGLATKTPTQAMFKTAKQAVLRFYAREQAGNHDQKRCRSESLRRYGKVGHQQHGDFFCVELFAWLRPSDAKNLEGDERCCLRLALERLHQTDQCVFKRCAPRSSSSTSPLRRSTYRRHSCGSAFRQFNATSVHTGFLSCPTDWVSFSGNEHSSAHRSLPFIIFAWFHQSDTSMLSVGSWRCLRHNLGVRLFQWQSVVHQSFASGARSRFARDVPAMR